MGCHSHFANAAHRGRSEVVERGRGGAWKGREGDAGGGVQALGEGQFRGVVVLAEVAEEDVAEAFVAELPYRVCAFRIGQVSVAAAYAGLQLQGIGTVTQHLGVVVALDDHRIRLLRPIESLCRHATYIGHYNELEVIQQNGVTNGLGGIVRHHEMPDLNTSRHYLVPCPVSQYHPVVSSLAACQKMPRKRTVQAFCSPDRFAYMLAERAEGAYVVRMVVSHQHGAEVVEAEAVGLKLFLQTARTHAGVNDDSGLAAAAVFAEQPKEIAVSAAPGREGLEAYATHRYGSICL